MLEKFCDRQKNNKLPRIILEDITRVVEQLEGGEQDASSYFHQALDRLKLAGGHLRKMYQDDDSSVRKKLAINIRLYIQACGEFFEVICATDTEFTELQTLINRFEQIATHEKFS